jgi:hypothetical protein
MDTVPLDMRWEPDRPRILVAACSDGRLQEATDRFLARALGVRQYDRLYLPGGGGALSASGADFMRAAEVRRECRFLIEAHGVEHLILLFHGPAAGGPPEAVCADYRRKHSWQRPDQVRAQQEADVRDLLGRRSEYAGKAQLSVHRFEVTAGGALQVAPLHVDDPTPARGRAVPRAPDRGASGSLPPRAFPG